jgi:hypothetical protein
MRNPSRSLFLRGFFVSEERLFLIVAIHPCQNA